MNKSSYLDRIKDHEKGNVAACPRKYSRIFKHAGVPYSYASAWFESLKKFDILIVSEANETTAYMPEDMLKRTLAEGLALYKDGSAFAGYIEKFDDYKKGAAESFKQIVDKKSLVKMI